MEQLRVQWGKRAELCKSIQFRLIGRLPRKGVPRKIPKDFKTYVKSNKFQDDFRCVIVTVNKKSFHNIINMYKKNLKKI